MVIRGSLSDVTPQIASNFRYITVKKLSAQIHFENLQGAANNPIFERF